MNAARLLLLIFAAVRGVLSGEYRFRAIHGQGVGSIKATMAVFLGRSKIHCITTCLALPNCGGFNYRRLISRSGQCDLKLGMSFGAWVRSENATIYYEKAGQNPSISSRDCSDLQAAGVAVSGAYDVNKNEEGMIPEFLQVYCDMDSAEGGWTVLLKREDGSVSFNNTWLEYKNGFGIISGEFWIGLDAIHNLTNNGKSYMARVDMRLFTGECGYAEYSTFRVYSEADEYKINITGYSGNTSDSFSYHDNMKFSTPDRDHDLYSKGNCADIYHGGFWYKACSEVRLTGLYGENYDNKQGILWKGWLGITKHPQYVDLKIKPTR